MSCQFIFRHISPVVVDPSPCRLPSSSLPRYNHAHHFPERLSSSLRLMCAYQFNLFCIRNVDICHTLASSGMTWFLTVSFLVLLLIHRSILIYATCNMFLFFLLTTRNSNCLLSRVPYTVVYSIISMTVLPAAAVTWTQGLKCKGHWAFQLRYIYRKINLPFTLTFNDTIYCRSTVTALPFIKRLVYPHIHGCRKGTPYTITDIVQVILANISLSTVSHISIIIILKRKYYFRIFYTYKFSYLLQRLKQVKTLGILKYNSP